MFNGEWIYENNEYEITAELAPKESELRRKISVSHFFMGQQVDIETVLKPGIGISTSEPGQKSTSGSDKPIVNASPNV